MNTVDTAHAYWNEAWGDAAKREDWETPEAEIADFATQLAPGSRVLDLGCGIGRHALMYAALGHKVTALDAAPDGLAELSRKAQAASLPVETCLGKMDSLPFDDGAFDHVLAFNVIYHGDEDTLRRTIEEIRRVLRPSGTYQSTMLTLRGLALTHAKLPGGREISRNTWVFDDDDGDKRHPHHFCGTADLMRLFGGFGILRVGTDMPEGGVGGRWHLIMERL
jgi:SAM-dependent methyltransferase